MTPRPSTRSPVIAWGEDRLKEPSPRERALAWARSVMADHSAVVVDTETLGTAHDAGLCDIAIVSVSGTVLFDSLINPGKPIPPEATNVHKIGDDDVGGEPYWFDISPTVAAILHGRRVIAFNARFDEGSINACCAAAGEPAIAIGWECAMLAHADWKGEPGKYRGSPRWWKLSDAAADLGIEPGTHRALADALTCLAVVKAMAEVSS